MLTAALHPRKPARGAPGGGGFEAAASLAVRGFGQARRRGTPGVGKIEKNEFHQSGQSGRLFRLCAPGRVDGFAHAGAKARFPGRGGAARVGQIELLRWNRLTKSAAISLPDAALASGAGKKSGGCFQPPRLHPAREQMPVSASACPSV